MFCGFCALGFGDACLLLDIWVLIVVALCLCIYACSWCFFLPGCFLVELFCLDVCAFRFGLLLLLVFLWLLGLLVLDVWFGGWWLVVLCCFVSCCLLGLVFAGCLTVGLFGCSCFGCGFVCGWFG